MLFRLQVSIISQPSAAIIKLFTSGKYLATKALCEFYIFSDWKLKILRKNKMETIRKHCNDCTDRWQSTSIVNPHDGYPLLSPRYQVCLFTLSACLPGDVNPSAGRSQGEIHEIPPFWNENLEQILRLVSISKDPSGILVSMTVSLTSVALHRICNNYSLYTFSLYCSLRYLQFGIHSRRWLGFRVRPVLMTKIYSRHPQII